MKIKVCIPHYFSKEVQSTQNYNLPGSWLPGSARGTPEKRKNSFLKCLWSLIHQGKQNDYVLLDIRTNQFHRLQKPIHKHQISISVMTDGKNICEEVLEQYKNYIEVKEVQLENSKDLVFEAREHLFCQNNYDLYLYCEDDIGFTTKNYFDKILWFAEQTNHQGVLMPHRLEISYSPDVEKLYIDGPIDQTLLEKFMIPKMNVLTLEYKGKNVIFNHPMNPHSATFCLTQKQKDFILKKGIERRSDFVSQFESVCTLTPMEFFDVYKTDFKYRTFLEVEQCYTNYC
jgi:hypothetical protein